MNDLARIVYYSRNVMPGTRIEILAQIRQILAVSQRNNAACEVTGALMFNNGCFAQILEGPSRGFERTFERIQRDDRHSDVTVLGYSPVVHRSFATWSMAFVGGHAPDALEFGAAVGNGVVPELMTEDTVFAALRRLVREEEAVV